MVRVTVKTIQAAFLWGAFFGILTGLGVANAIFFSTPSFKKYSIQKRIERMPLELQLAELEAEVARVKKNQKALPPQRNNGR